VSRIFNLHGDEWDRSEERPGWRSNAARVGARIGAELIGGSLYELEPGDRLWPYHTHHANEEWILVVGGHPTLRTPEGEQTLNEGDVVAFRRGQDGLHQVTNRTEVPIRVLMLSTLIAPDLVHYADSGKYGARDAKGERCFSAAQARRSTTGTAKTERHDAFGSAAVGVSRCRRATVSPLRVTS
jgi:uncharacterized cupin superfamily protein